MTKIQGFYTILMDICCDYIQLQIELKIQYRNQYQEIFLSKYNITYDIIQSINLQSILYLFTILLPYSWSQHQKLQRINWIINHITVKLLNPLELYRLYTCLAINIESFIQLQAYKHQADILQTVYRLDNHNKCTIQSGYFLLFKIITYPSNQPDHHLIIQKIFNQITNEFSRSWTRFPFQTILDTLHHKQIYSSIINLQWINRCLLLLNNRLLSLIEHKQTQQSLMIIILKLYVQILKISNKKIKQNQQFSYPSFHEDKSKYYQLSTSLIISNIFTYLQKIIKQRQHLEQYDIIIQYYTTIILQILIQQISLNQHQFTSIINHTLLIINHQQYQSNKLAYHLLYQLINRRINYLSQNIHHLISKWMNNIYYQSEQSLNIVCIILQSIYHNLSQSIYHNLSHPHPHPYITIYSSIIQSLFHKYLQILLQYHNYIKLVDQQFNNNHIINQLTINFNPQIKNKYNPITIIRLYNTLLFNPYIDLNLISKTHDKIRKYTYQIIPHYDLSIQVLALQSLLQHTNHISIIQCFTFTTQLLNYNLNNDKQSIKTSQQKQIDEITSNLEGKLTKIDPYQAYCYIIQNHIYQSDQINRQYNQPYVNILDFIKTDPYLYNTVKKLRMIRSINKKPRTILKIRKIDIQ